MHSNGVTIRQTDPQKIKDLYLNGCDPVHYILLTVNRNRKFELEDEDFEFDIRIENTFKDVYLVKVDVFDVKNNHSKNKYFEVYVKEKRSPFTYSRNPVYVMDEVS